MLEKRRAWATARMGVIASPFEGWSPNTLSWSSFGLSCGAGLFFVLLRFVSPSSYWVPVLFFEAASCVFVGGVFDALDGYVARKRGLASKQGDFLDHVLDRYSDVVILLGVTFSAWANPYLALVALVSLLISSYLGTQAQAVTGQRMYGGLLGRADRIVLVSLFALALFGATTWNLFAPVPDRLPLTWTWLGVVLGPLDLLLIYFIVAGQITSLYRARRTWNTLASP